ncbi:MAG: Ig-like domain-containing protein [Acidimicrobiales bacterium]
MAGGMRRRLRWDVVLPGAGRGHSAGAVARVAVLVAAVCLLAGCTAAAERVGSAPSARALAPAGPRSELIGMDVGPSGSDQAGSSVPEPLQVVFQPVGGTVDVRPDTAVRVEVAGGSLRDLQVVTPEGPVAGQVDNGVFRPAGGLRFGTEYRLRAIIADGSGAMTTHQSAFLTMAPPEELIEAWVTPTTGEVVGVGMPVIVNFSESVPPEERAAVQARLRVHSEPAVPGAWRWIDDAEIHWRPLQYWPARTNVWVAADLAGTSAAGRWFSASTLEHFTIGDHHRMTMDAAAHMMSVFRNGELIREIPISAGREDYPTASGVDLIMEKHDQFEMDSTTVGIYGADAYNLVVDDAQRLTNSGTFIHAAPWNSSLGAANLSHGCINASNEDAQWLMDFTLIGDPVEISNTSERVAPGNGWGDWNLTPEEWVSPT